MGYADVGSDTTDLKQARSLIGAHDYEGAIELLAPLDSPSPNETYALADSWFLHASTLKHKSKCNAAYRKAIKLYPLCYDQCSNPRSACRAWAVCARMLEDENELIRAKEAGLKETGDGQLIIIHYFLKRDQNAPEAEREELIDEALRIEPEEPNSLIAKAGFLMRRREWKEAWGYQSKAINGFNNKQREHGLFPDLLARTSLLALVCGIDEQEYYLEWAQKLDGQTQSVVLPIAIRR